MNVSTTHPSTGPEACSSQPADVRSLIHYAGCLCSDPFFSLKQCDEIVLSTLNQRGVQVNRLAEKLPMRPVFRKLNRNLLYPALVARATKQSAVSPLTTSDLRPSTSSVLHISSQCYAHLIPKAKCPVSITVHDVAEFDYPEDYSPRQLRRWRKRMRHIKEADLVFAISEHTKKDLVELLDVSEEKVIVNYNGVGDEFLVLKEEEVSETIRNFLGVKCQDCHAVALHCFRKLKPVSRRFGVGFRKGDFFLILATGANLYRKNISVLLEAVAILRKRGVPALLIKAGDAISTTHNQQLTKLGISESVYDLGYVSTQELVGLYNLCNVLAFPSLYEGFGLPVVEAQRCGLPCVISDAASLPEVGGNGALYHDPTDAIGLADQLQRVYGDKALRSDLREKGFKNAARFSWDRHVDTLIAEYRRLGLRC